MIVSTGGSISVELVRATVRNGRNFCNAAFGQSNCYIVSAVADSLMFNWSSISYGTFVLWYIYLFRRSKTCWNIVVRVIRLCFITLLQWLVIYWLLVFFLRELMFLRLVTLCSRPLFLRAVSSRRLLMFLWSVAFRRVAIAVQRLVAVRCVLIIPPAVSSLVLFTEPG